MEAPVKYSFDGFGGFDNCDLCEEDTTVNEYTRLTDGRSMMICKQCEKGDDF